MALSAASSLAAYSLAAGTKKLDLSDELAEIIKTDNTALLQKIGVGGLVATELKHQWNEDSLNPNTATEGGTGINSSATSVSVLTGEGLRFRVGSIFKDNTAGKTEVMRVTAISTDTLTITRGIGSTVGETHAASFPIMIIAHTKQEDWTPTGNDWSKERSVAYNYLSTMGYEVKISYIRQAVNKPGVPDEFAHQAAYRLKEFMRQLDSSIINSVRSGSEGGAADYHSMGGLIEFVSQSGGNVNTTSEAITPSVINASVKNIWDKGGLVAGGRLALVVGGVQKRAISAFDQAYRRLDFNSNAVGYTVEKILTDLGFELEVIVDPWMPNDVYIIGDLNRVKVGPLQTDAVRIEDLAKAGRYLNSMLTGSYTTEIRNATEAFAIHTGLTG